MPKTKKATNRSPFVLSYFVLISFAAERHQQLQQVDEQVVDVQVQASVAIT